MNEVCRPRRFQKPISTFWWLQRRSYFVFVLREVSCLFVAWFIVFLLLLVAAIGAGPERYRQFLMWSATPWVLLLNFIALLFVTLHAVTWFNQVPQAIVLRLRGRPVPRIWIVAHMYLLWAVISTIVVWLVIGG
jgi:fumarate reductase subunit C